MNARNRKSTLAHDRARAAERGAALVVGMILLLILTLLAISGMSTSTTELVMAGNEQFQENAFQAAETGIERTIATGAFDAAAEVVGARITLPSADAGCMADPTDVTRCPTYQATVRPRGSSPPPPGYSLDQFSAENFEIQSLGTSVRDATDTHVQGLFLIVPKAN
jgi:Tfp pilus assembly protein PilX